jgi:hypothetical protein
MSNTQNAACGGQDTIIPRMPLYSSLNNKFTRLQQSLPPCPACQGLMCRSRYVEVTREPLHASHEACAMIRTDA